MAKRVSIKDIANEVGDILLFLAVLMRIQLNQKLLLKLY